MSDKESPAYELGKIEGELRAQIDFWRSKYDGTAETAAYMWCANDLEKTLEEFQDD